MIFKRLNIPVLERNLFESVGNLYWLLLIISILWDLDLVALLLKVCYNYIYNYYLGVFKNMENKRLELINVLQFSCIKTMQKGD